MLRGFFTFSLAVHLQLTDLSFYSSCSVPCNTCSLEQSPLDHMYVLFTPTAYVGLLGEAIHLALYNGFLVSECIATCIPHISILKHV